MHKTQSNILHHLKAPKAISPDPATGYYNPFPSFPFSGPLRPVYPLSEHRTIPKSIPHPVWSEDGNPKYSRSLANRNKFDILDAKGIEAMRKVGKLAREVLDLAAEAAKPGVTTDYVDEVVHKACIERKVRPRRIAAHMRLMIYVLPYLHGHRVLVISFAAQLQPLPQVMLYVCQRSHLPRYS